MPKSAGGFKEGDKPRLLLQRGQLMRRVRGAGTAALLAGRPWGQPSLVISELSFMLGAPDPT